MLWLSRQVHGREAQDTDVPLQVVTDVLVVPDTSDVQWIQYGGLCGPLRPNPPEALEPEDVAADPEIVALVRIEEMAWVYTDVVRAWRADRDIGRFVPIRPDDIACFSETGPSYRG